MSPSSYGCWDTESLYNSVECHLSSWLSDGCWDIKSLYKSVDMPYSFLTNTTALHHALWLGQIMYPNPTFLHKCLWTSSMRGRGIHLNCSLNGVSLSNFNDMFGWMGAAKFAGLQWEDDCGTQPIETWCRSHHLRCPMIPIHSDPIPQTTSLSFVSQLTWAFDGCYPPPPPIAPNDPIGTRGSGTQVTSTALTTGVFFLRAWG